MAEEATVQQGIVGRYNAQAAFGGTAAVNVTEIQWCPPPPVSDEELAAAEARLAELPLDSVPRPGPLAPGSRVLLHPNALFVGREDELRELAGRFKEPGPTGRTIVALSGIGGWARPSWPASSLIAMASTSPAVSSG